MNVIALPASLDRRAMDDLFAEVSGVEGRALLDGRHIRFVDPNGMIALLSAGRLLVERTGGPVRLSLPENADAQSYMARIGFFRAAEGLFEMDQRPPRGSGRGDSNVLLEITSISKNADVHEVVDRVQQAAGTILSSTLGYPPTSVVPFSVILSEVCQNILEHAEAPGWVAAQAYNWQKRIGRHVLVIAVGDMGRGFRGSLADEHSARFGDRWGDAAALEAAFMMALSRFPDSHRGQGIQQIRKQVRRWDGSISIRSGTARIADVPVWDDSPPMQDHLAHFPGSQISIVLPAKERTDG